MFLFSCRLVLFCFVFCLLFVCLYFFSLFPFCPSPANSYASALTYCIIVRGSDACALIGAFVQNWVASILGDLGLIVDSPGSGSDTAFTAGSPKIRRKPLRGKQKIVLSLAAYNVTITGCKLVSHWELFFKLACCAVSDKKIYLVPLGLL